MAEIHHNFCACCLWHGPSLMTLWCVIYFQFVDDVMFIPKWQLNLNHSGDFNKSLHNNSKYSLSVAHWG